MSLLLPETGLVFWMLISFSVVFFISAKWGWPVITGMVDKRADFIDASIKTAKEANMQYENLKTEMQLLINSSHEKQGRILKEAAIYRNTMMQEARQKAHMEAAKLIEDARNQMRVERENLMNEIRIQVAGLSVVVAEKVIRNELCGENKQIELLEKMFEEAYTLKH